MEVETLASRKAFNDDASPSADDGVSRSRWTLVLAVMATALVVQAAAYATRSANPYQTVWLVDTATTAPLMDAAILQEVCDAQQQRLEATSASRVAGSQAVGSQALELAYQVAPAPSVSVGYAGKESVGLAKAKTLAAAIAESYQQSVASRHQQQVQKSQTEQAALELELKDLDALIAKVRDEQYTAQVLLMESQRARAAAEQAVEIRDNAESADEPEVLQTSFPTPGLPTTGLGPLFVIPVIEASDSSETDSMAIALPEEITAPSASDVFEKSLAAEESISDTVDKLADELQDLQAAKQAIGYQIEVASADLDRLEAQPLPAPPRLVLRSKTDRGWVTSILLQAPLVMGLVLAAATLALAPRKRQPPRIEQRQIITPLRDATTAGATPSRVAA